MRKPSLTLRCVANNYAMDGERIAEFSFPAAVDSRGELPGGLISFRYMPNGPPLVSLYRVEGCEVQTERSAALEAAARGAFDLLTIGKAAQGLDVNPYSLPAVVALRDALGIVATPQPERPRAEVYETATGLPTGDFWPLDLGVSQAACVALASNHAAKLGAGYGARVIGAPDVIDSGEFARCIEAGYTVMEGGEFGNDSGFWMPCDPEGLELVADPGLPTERAAWTACDNHRQFGDVIAPAMANEGPTL